MGTFTAETLKEPLVLEVIRKPLNTQIILMTLTPTLTQKPKPTYKFQCLVRLEVIRIVLQLL